MEYDEIDWLRRQDRAWRLLRADHAPLVLRFLGQVFIDDNIRSISGDQLAERLDDTLFALNEQYGEATFPKNARAYLGDWADAGWLRRYCPPDSDEVHFDAIPAVERALAWVRTGHANEPRGCRRQPLPTTEPTVRTGGLRGREAGARSAQGQQEVRSNRRQRRHHHPACRRKDLVPSCSPFAFPAMANAGSRSEDTVRVRQARWCSLHQRLRRCEEQSTVRFIINDTVSLLMVVMVCVASVQDRDGAKTIGEQRLKGCG
ncbi:DUF3375 family protein [Micromonospora saelicesensis]|uniref:DUF3375 family protein n=1 Tax=Micromonospora saelicesensis TaxID=285676 RepID=UPI003CFBB6AF